MAYRAIPGAALARAEYSLYPATPPGLVLAAAGSLLFGVVAMALKTTEADDVGGLLLRPDRTLHVLILLATAVRLIPASNLERDRRPWTLKLKALKRMRDPANGRKAAGQARVKVVGRCDRPATENCKVGWTEGRNGSNT